MAIISSTSNNQNHHECNKLTNMVAKASPLTLPLEELEPLLDGPLELVLLVDGLVGLVPVPLVVVLGISHVTMAYTSWSPTITPNLSLIHI